MCIRDRGDTGVSLAGSFANGTSKGVAHPAALNVTGNLVSEVGTYSRQGSCFWQGIAGSIADEGPISISDNVCFNSPRHGIEVNDGFGMGTVFERNVVFSCMQETVDGGPVHSWNREPHNLLGVCLPKFRQLKQLRPHRNALPPGAE